MNNLQKIIFIIILLFVFGSSSGAIYYYGKLNTEYESNVSYSTNEFKYHFSLILKENDDAYWSDFKKGVYESAQVNNIAIELNTVDEINSNEQIVEYIDIAIMSQVDGIIVNGSNTDEYVSSLSQASEKGLGIIVSNTEVIDSSKLSYIGTNFYEYGVQSAKLVSQLAKKRDPIEVAIILSSDNADREFKDLITQNDIMMSGFRSVADENENMEVVTTLYRESDLLGAEGLTRDILTEFEGVDVIFTSNVKDTIAATRVIIERNLVGEVKVVGTGVTEEIINYIEKDLIFGVLDRNGYEVGYQSVESLNNSLEENFQPSYEDIDVDIYTKTNIGKYNLD